MIGLSQRPKLLLSSALFVVFAAAFIYRSNISKGLAEEHCADGDCALSLTQQQPVSQPPIAIDLPLASGKNDATIYIDRMIEGRQWDFPKPRRQPGVELEPGAGAEAILMREQQYPDQSLETIDEAALSKQEFDAEPSDLNWAHEQQYRYVDLFSSNQKLASFTLLETVCKSTSCRLSLDLQDEIKLGEVLTVLAEEAMANDADLQVFVESDLDQALTNLYVRR